MTCPPERSCKTERFDSVTSLFPLRSLAEKKRSRQSSHLSQLAIYLVNDSVFDAFLRIMICESALWKLLRLFGAVLVQLLGMHWSIPGRRLFIL